MQPGRLRCEYLANPLGIGERRPRLSWDLAGDRAGARQVAYQVVADGWDSGRVESAQTRDVAWAGPALPSRQRVEWRVRVWDDNGAVTESDTASFETGLLDAADWSAAWIARPAAWPQGAAQPTPVLRREFELDDVTRIVRARLYITALGLYEARANGARVGDQRLTPGWTDYRARVQYQTYDVAPLLQTGANVLEVEVADGWYAGWLGFVGDRELYGNEPHLRAQLVVDYPGDVVTIATDESWLVAQGPRRAADLLMGETYDARVALSDWIPARRTRPFTGEIVAPVAPATRAIGERAPVTVTEAGNGARIVDFGQNLVGWVRLRTRGARGTTVTLRFAEVLDAEGNLYVDNLRTARSVDTYILAGDGEEEYEPAFTFHGFRYAEITGPGELTAVVCGADLEVAGTFACSDPDINQLQQNIVWGMRGNFLEVPTDCPQRDERLGWMGDAQVFAPTACFNADVSGFFARWMTDVIDGQTDDGGFPDVAPRVVDPQDGAPGWGDAGVIVPWVVYERYGDRELLARCFPAMAAWVDYIEAANPNLLWLERRNGDMGDWLSLDADSPKDVVATSFFAHSASLVARAAEALGRADDAELYGALAEAIRTAYTAAYVDEGGDIAGGTQTVYALALRFELLPVELRARTAAHLVADIEARAYHLSTGFLGVAHLLPALSDHGHGDVAYRLLHQDTFPSWLYQVRHGATTMWERWDGWTEAGGFQDPAMNSFNHYAFGAVGEWLYEYVAGIRPDPAHPGFRRAIIEPRPGGRLEWVDATHRGYGVRWNADRLEVTVPANCEAEVRLRNRPPAVVGAGAHVFDVD